MKRIFFCMIILIGILPIVYSEDAKPVPIAYCEHAGYKIEINFENKPICDFGDGTSCNPSEFYYGDCRQDKKVDIPPRTEGQTVYTQFENCEEGLVPSTPKYLLDQPICEKPPSAIKKFFNSLIEFFS